VANGMSDGTVAPYSECVTRRSQVETSGVIKSNRLWAESFVTVPLGIPQRNDDVRVYYRVTDEGNTIR